MYLCKLSHHLDCPPLLLFGLIISQSILPVCIDRYIMKNVIVILLLKLLLLLSNCHKKKVNRVILWNPNAPYNKKMPIDLVNQILKNLERKSQYNRRRWKLKKGETWWNKACVAFSCLAGRFPQEIFL